MFDRFTSLLSLIIFFLTNSEACMRSPASGKIYDFTVTDIDGNEVQLKKYLNKEPGTDQEIKQRVLAKYNVTFDLFHKIDVNGENAIPLYKFLKQSISSWFSRDIEWNFVKFLVDRNGTPVSRYISITPPNSMEAEIRKLLGLSNEL
ncbi:unnamed protein product [Schistosoma rodhaini]|uniref:Glutathione peroxidase n=1 Tax=Schistosoma rodhaini TaxID=6188 RepID=A0AA85FD90_9TREM|nr:unnamed protein product [Schistosoma rodhaini]